MEEAVRLFRSTREYLTPQLAQSAFYERGMLTPEEFVRAGDHLVRTCPSWQWESGEQSKIRPYLPPNKQFLVTRGVPSYSRVKTMQSSNVVEDRVGGGLGEGDADWCAPKLVAQDNEFDVVDPNEFTAAAEITKDMKEMEISKPSAVTAEEDEYLDMEDETLALDEATAAVQSATGDGHKATTAAASGEQLVRTRRYDVSMTYDNYYRTPRIWLYGFDENGTELRPDDVFEDVMQDYANKTVTIDPHPHLKYSYASIHPCQHGAAMLNIIQSLKDSGSKPPTVEQYLFFFLKFIQSVVPTIEYDNTVDVQVGRAEEPVEGKISR